jgi:hypothetical protein
MGPHFESSFFKTTPHFESSFQDNQIQNKNFFANLDSTISRETSHVFINLKPNQQC